MFRDVFGAIFYYLITVGCFSFYVGLLVFTLGLREFQTNIKIREIGKNLFKKFF